MSQAQTFYEANPFYGGLTWSLVTEQIGQDLRERYQVPKELPPKLFAAVGKLKAIESKSTRERTLIERLRVSSVAGEPTGFLSGTSNHQENTDELPG